MVFRCIKQNKAMYFIILSIVLIILVALYFCISLYKIYQENQVITEKWKKNLMEKEYPKDIQTLLDQTSPINEVNIQPSIHNQAPTINKKNIKSAMYKTSSISPNSFASKKTNIASSIKPFNSRLIAGISGDQCKLASKFLNIKNQDSKESQLTLEEKNYYQEKYSISQYDELPFCIVIPSYNNARNDRHLKNIKSVVMQDYSNYHIVFIDDASTDSTGEQVKAFLDNSQVKIPPQRYLVIKNQVSVKAMPNLRRAAKQFCKPEDIFLIVDGDDQIIGRQVLKLFNSQFQEKGAWFVYTNFLNMRESVGYSRPFPQNTKDSNTYRKYPFVTSHLRAFYTQLFLNIRQQDLKDGSGNYLKAANDVAICIPILQQSQNRVEYLPQLTYYYNANTGLNNHQIRLKQQKSNDRMIRKRAAYPKLAQLFQAPVNQNKNSTIKT